ncbi:uncharacterized protein [Euwallacea similis]|uniref:uncharacterized protein n=1 Tax=Euwallacea similis TaxID=1736056 RepID=UPI00344B7C7B
MEVEKEQMDKQIKLLELKCKHMNDTIEKANWERLVKTNLLDVRSFIDYFDRNCITNNSNERNRRFTLFIQNEDEQLKEWGLPQIKFTKIFPQLYEKVCKAAHPTFFAENALIITNISLEPTELKIIGFLWDKLKLPKEKLQVKNENKLSCIFEEYKNKN